VGSEGRREQTLRTDQDNGLVYADPARIAPGTRKLTSRDSRRRRSRARPARLSALSGRVHGVEPPLASLPVLLARGVRRVDGQAGAQAPPLCLAVL
jgi:hypothetical protein